MKNNLFKLISAQIVDEEKRRLLGLGGLAGVLSACVETRPPVERTGEPEPEEQETTSTGKGDEENTVGADCNCMAPGTTTPPGATTPPGDTTPPGTGTTTPDPTAGTLLPATQTFTALRASTAVSASMGMSKALSDGSSVSIWGFTPQGATVPAGFNDDRPSPGPVIEAIQGQPVNVTLTSGMPHTIHWHGLDVDQANDGVPATSGFVGMLPMMGNFGRVRGYTSLGQVFTYNFIAPHAGTYAYHCHVDTVLHMEMGMSGTLIVRPPDGSTNVAWEGGPAFEVEYIWQLHTYQTGWHFGSPMSAVSGPALARYRPDVFLINGMEGPDLLTDPTTAVAAAAGQRVLIRLVNLGYQPAEVWLGGESFEVIASDGRPLANGGVTTDRWLVGPGERYDVILTMPALTAALEAQVNYQDIRGRRVLGSAVTTMTSV